VKHIIKGNGPQSLRDWAQGQRDAGLSPAFGDLQNPQKAECRDELLLEQGSLCCYCNRRISAGRMHIEHLVPQSVQHDLEVVWTNLLGCCEPQNLKGHKLQTQCHCGEYRRNTPVGVSPLDPTCETQFRYTLRGDIEPKPSDNAQAKLAINNLNLRAERLRHSREVLIREAYATVDALSESEWLAVYVEKQEEAFPEFAAMFRWFFDDSWRDEKRALEAETGATN
jgi:uncharacterized protein (TIGR02646 family)